MNWLRNPIEIATTTKVSAIAVIIFTLLTLLPANYCKASNRIATQSMSGPRNAANESYEVTIHHTGSGRPSQLPDDRDPRIAETLDSTTSTETTLETTEDHSEHRVVDAKSREKTTDRRQARNVKKRRVSENEYIQYPETSTDTEELPEVFHYTLSEYLETILLNGLWEEQYATPDGELTGLQAKLELSLKPTKSPPTAKIRIDLRAMAKDGYKIPPVKRVKSMVTEEASEKDSIYKVRYGFGRAMFMPGGGYELLFPYRIPPKYLSKAKIQ